MEQTELERVAEAILFAAGEPVELERIAIAAECDPDEAEQAVRSLMDRLSYERRGIRILRLEHAYQMCSSGEMSSYVTRALETRKPPRLSSAQLETLTVKFRCLYRRNMQAIFAPGEMHAGLVLASKRVESKLYF